MSDNIVEKVLHKDIENIIKKAAQGKPLTDTERARIEKAYGKSEEKKYADNVVELAEILGVNRKTIARWRKSKDAPKPLSNGTHDIAKWREFAKTNGLKENDTPEETALKIRKLLAEVKQAELKLSVMEGNYVSIEKVREIWTAHIGQVRSIFESRLLNELPPILTALDAIQIREKLRDVLDEAYSAISIASESIKETVD
jgi:hypothetical protein